MGYSNDTADLLQEGTKALLLCTLFHHLLPVNQTYLGGSGARQQGEGDPSRLKYLASERQSVTSFSPITWMSTTILARREARVKTLYIMSKK